MASSTSAIMVTRGDATMLPLALESLRGQHDADVEVVLVDTSTEEPTQKAVAALADTLESRLSVVRVFAPGASLGAAYNRGIRSADGDRVLLLRETGVASRRFLAAHQGATDEVVISPRRSLLSRWFPRLPGVTGPRLRPLLARRPDLMSLPSSQEPRELLTAADVRERFERVVPELSFVDHVWERFSPLLQRYSPALQGCPLPWLAGLGGYLSAPRRALYQAGLFDEADGDLQIDDPEPFLALYRAGLRFRVDEEAVIYHQVAPLSTWPFCAFPMLDRLAARRDPLDVWLLLRYLADDDVLGLADLAASLSVESTARKLFVDTVEELLPLSLSDLRVWWSEFA